MDPVSNVDRLVLLLRQRLHERDRSSKTNRKAREKKSALSAATALAAVDSVDEYQLRRAIIQGILGDHFGSAVVNEARFQQVVDRVVLAIASDDDARALLDRVGADLKRG